MSENKSHDPNQMTGAAMIVRAFKDHGVKHIFGYPGGAVLPIYDEIFQQSEVQHILVRHEQGAGHARHLPVAETESRRARLDRKKQQGCTAVQNREHQ